MFPRDTVEQHLVFVWDVSYNTVEQHLMFVWDVSYDTMKQLLVVVRDASYDTVERHLVVEQDVSSIMCLLMRRLLRGHNAYMWHYHSHIPLKMHLV